MIVALGAVAIYLGLLGFSLQRRPKGSRAGTWLAIFCAYSIILMAVHTLILGNRLPEALASFSLIFRITGFMISVGLLAALTSAYVESRIQPIIWGIPLLLWLVLWLAIVLTQPQSAAVGSLPSLVFAPQIALETQIVLGGWLLFALVMFILVGRAFLMANLPLLANRVLLWALVMPILLVGDALSGWLGSPWNIIGYGLRLLGTFGAVYGVISHHVIDLRALTRWMVSRAALVIVTAAVIVGAIAIVLFAPLDFPNEVLRWVAIASLGLVMAILHQPIQAGAAWVIHRLGAGREVDPAEAVRLYSERISGIIDLRELSAVAVKTLNQLLSTRRGYLILARQYQDHVGLEVIGRVWGEASRATPIQTSSPIFQHFMAGGKSLLQFDIEYGKEFTAAPEAERKYFHALEMDIYAPIIKETQLIGILALGPKTNDQPFKAQETELLVALAHQTVAALENARLVSDLRSLNEKNRLLNEDLRLMNERLERMDGVKSDFISIASHELRTPLTQIQGYADLINEMSDRNLLDLGQLNDMSSRLVAAAERMAEVLNAIMDVTEIDVENLDMTFEHIKLSDIIRQAIEPYQEAVTERTLILTLRGLDDLPMIEGDPKRLTQVFQNLISNAIKFTPDGGKVDISGVLLGSSESGINKNVQIIVADTGIGIDRESMQLIFEKFFRVAPVELHSTGATKFKGAGPGLGLPIAKGIVEGHGGRIWVESRGYDEVKLYGSTFNVVLPIHPPAKDLRNRIMELSAQSNATHSGRSSDHFATRPGLRG